MIQTLPLLSASLVGGCERLIGTIDPRMTRTPNAAKWRHNFDQYSRVILFHLWANGLLREGRKTTWDPVATVRDERNMKERDSTDSSPIEHVNIIIGERALALLAAEYGRLPTGLRVPQPIT